MTAFITISSLLLITAMLFVAVPLWRARPVDNAVERDAANLEIFRDQMAEMDADLANGLLTPELHEQGKRELQARLLEEVEGAGAASAHRSSRILAVVLVVLMPFLAVGLYLKVGNLAAFMPQNFHTVETGTVHNEAALKALEEKVAKNPQDAESLGTIARTYAEQERYVDAAKAYSKLAQLVPNDAQLWADFADVLAMANGQNLAGPPTALLNKALALDPNNVKALALAGSAAMARGEPQAAIGYWEKLSKMLPPDSEDAKMIAEGLAQAHAMLDKGGSTKKPQAAGAERITGSVTLSPALKDKVSPGDTLFVLARAESGPPMPLAVIRGQAKDLPMQFQLDDSLAMSPQARLSGADKVKVVARITKSGDPMPHEGDLQGTSAIVKPGAQGLKITIDSVVK